MGRRSYSGEKRRKELQRKAKRDAKAERKRAGAGEAGGGPPIDWESQFGGQSAPPEEAAEGAESVQDGEAGAREA